MDGSTNVQYNVAKVDWMEDTVVEDPVSLERLSYLRTVLDDEVHNLRNKYVNEMNSTLARYFLTKLYRMKISEDAILEILKAEKDEPSSMYSLPTDPSELSWRILDFLPFPDDFKFRFLAVTDLQRRMEMVLVVLQSLREIKNLRLDNHGNDSNNSVVSPVRDQSVDESTFEVEDTIDNTSDTID